MFRSAMLSVSADKPRSAPSRLWGTSRLTAGIEDLQAIDGVNLSSGFLMHPEEHKQVFRDRYSASFAKARVAMFARFRLGAYLPIKDHHQTIIMIAKPKQ